MGKTTWVIMGLDNGLLPDGTKQTIDWTDADLPIGSSGTNIRENVIHAFPFKKIHL